MAIRKAFLPSPLHEGVLLLFFFLSERLPFFVFLPCDRPSGKKLSLAEPRSPSGIEAEAVFSSRGRPSFFFRLEGRFPPPICLKKCHHEILYFSSGLPLSFPPLPCDLKFRPSPLIAKVRYWRLFFSPSHTRISSISHFLPPPLPLS